MASKLTIEISLRRSKHAGQKKPFQEAFEDNERATKRLVAQYCCLQGMLSRKRSFIILTQFLWPLLRANSLRL
jgi:hypothetical protein